MKKAEEIKKIFVDLLKRSGHWAHWTRPSFRNLERTEALYHFYYIKPCPSLYSLATVSNLVKRRLRVYTCILDNYYYSMVNNLHEPFFCVPDLGHYRKNILLVWSCSCATQGLQLLKKLHRSLMLLLLLLLLLFPVLSAILFMPSLPLTFRIWQCVVML